MEKPSMCINYDADRDELESALGRAIESWRSGRYPRRADVQALLDDGYDIGVLEKYHFKAKPRLPVYGEKAALRTHERRVLKKALAENRAGVVDGAVKFLKAVGDGEPHVIRGFRLGDDAAADPSRLSPMKTLDLAEAELRVLSIVGSHPLDRIVDDETARHASGFGSQEERAAAVYEYAKRRSAEIQQNIPPKGE